MKVAYLFPGQGVDLAAVGSAWYEGSAHGRRLLEIAARQVRVPVCRLVHGSGLLLRETRFFQPVCTAVSVAAWLELGSRGARADVVAGHSLGEIAACVAAGAINPERGVELSAARGAAMADAASSRGGGMAAIAASARETVEGAVLAARSSGVHSLDIAAHNAPDEWVVSGDIEALRALPARLTPTLLETSGPWHSAAMMPAEQAYRQALREARIVRPALPLVCNRTGSALRADEDLAELLAAQLTNPVQWASTMTTLAGMGITTLVTLGPAKPLRSLARRNLGGSVEVLAVDAPSDVAPVSERLRS